MRTTVLAWVLLMTVTATVFAEKTNELTVLQGAQEKQQLSLLAQYGTALETILADLKKKGDLDGVLLVQGEQKRFAEEKTIPAIKDAKDSFRAATEAYYQSTAALLGQYIKTLDGLTRREVAADRIEEAKAVRAEKDKADFMLADIQTKLPGKATIAKDGTGASTKPGFQRSVFKPKTYVDEARGFAGNPVESHNIYTFNIEQVGRRARLRFWAGGDMYPDTFGSVTLTPPGKEEEAAIYAWKTKDFKILADKAASYKDLKPITVDVSKLVKEAGVYSIKFKYTSGHGALVIMRLELDID